MRLDGKTALVTGAGSGIGRAMAVRLAAAGAHVVVSDLDGPAADAVAALIVAGGHLAMARQLDVASEHDVEAAIADIDAAHGLDILVNNAGIAFQQPLIATETDAFRRVLDVNVLGLFVALRSAARAMIASGRHGRIVNVASISGLRGSTGRIAYGASKAAVINMTQVAAVELAPHRITVNAIAPGPVETALVKRVHTQATREGWARHVPQRRYAEPEEIAGAAVYLASDEAAFTTGQVLAVDGGFAGAGLIFDIAGEGG